MILETLHNYCLSAIINTFTGIGFYCSFSMTLVIFDSLLNFIICFQVERCSYGNLLVI